MVGEFEDHVLLGGNHHHERRAGVIGTIGSHCSPVGEVGHLDEMGDADRVGVERDSVVIENDAGDMCLDRVGSGRCGELIE
jgi:hypothetical protein